MCLNEDSVPICRVGQWMADKPIGDVWDAGGWTMRITVHSKK